MQFLDKISLDIDLGQIYFYKITFSEIFVGKLSNFLWKVLKSDNKNFIEKKTVILSLKESVFRNI